MRFEIALFAGLSLALVACPGTLDEDKFRTVTTCSDPVKEIFTPTCAVSGCHSTADSDSSGKLDLQAPNVATRLLGKSANGGSGLLIDPVTPEKSVILTKLDRTTLPFGTRMPLGQPALNSVQIKCVHDWVVANSGGGPPGDGGAETSEETGSDGATDAAEDVASDTPGG